MYPVYMRFGDAQSCIMALARSRLMACGCIMALARVTALYAYSLLLPYSPGMQRKSSPRATRLPSQEGEID